MGAHITKTLVLQVILSKCEIWLNPNLELFLAMSIVPPQNITTSFLDNCSVFRSMEFTMSLTLALGFVYPITLNELPSRLDNFSEQPLTWLSPNSITLGLCLA